MKKNLGIDKIQVITMGVGCQGHSRRIITSKRIATVMDYNMSSRKKNP